MVDHGWPRCGASLRVEPNRRVATVNRRHAGHVPKLAVRGEDGRHLLGVDDAVAQHLHHALLDAGAARGAAWASVGCAGCWCAGTTARRGSGRWLGRGGGAVDSHDAERERAVRVRFCGVVPVANVRHHVNCQAHGLQPKAPHRVGYTKATRRGQQSRLHEGVVRVVG